MRLRADVPYDEAELTAFLKARIGSVKTPKAFHVADELPKSAVGKVLRREGAAASSPPSD